MKAHLPFAALLLILFSGSVHSLAIYSEKELLAEIPIAHFERIATSKIRVGRGEFSAISFSELLELCQATADSVIVSDESHSIRFNQKQFNEHGLFLLFGEAGSAKVYSPDFPSANLPQSVERITLQKKSYFSRKFLLEILAIIIAGFFVFRRSGSLFLRCSFLFVASYVMYQPFDLPAIGNKSDNFWYVPTSLSILNEGNLDLSEYRNLANLNRPDYRIIHIGSMTYNAYPLGPPLFTLPLVWIGTRIYPDSIPEQQRIQDIAAFVAKLIAALSVSLLFATAFRLTNRTGLSFGVALLFGFATNHFNTHAGGLWSHNVALPFLIAALLMLTSQRPVVLSLVAIPLALSYITRPTYSLVIVVITVYLIVYHRKSVLLYLLIGATSAAGFFLWNYRVYGHPLSTLYESSTLGFSNFATGLAGHMISPNRGLLIFSPIFLWSFYGIYLSWQKAATEGPPEAGATNAFCIAGVPRALSTYFRLLSILVLTGWLLLSLQVPARWGGHCIGPRQFCDMLPLWILLLLPAFHAILHLKMSYRIPLLTLVLMTIAWSFFVQLRSVTEPAVHGWNDTPVTVEKMPERVWDWRDMQIFRTNSNQARKAIEIWCGPTLIAKIPEGYFRRIAKSEIRVNQRKLRAVPVRDLVELCGVEFARIRIGNERETVSLNPSEIQKLQLYFISIRATGEKEPRLYSGSMRQTSFNGAAWKITVEEGS